MNNKTYINVLVFLFSIVFANLSANPYNSESTGSWNDTDVWEDEGAIGYNFGNNNITFNINENDTIYINEGETVTFDGNNITFNILGLFIVNGDIEFTKNNTDLEVNGSMIVNGSVIINGGGNSSVGGDGTISVGENGTFDPGDSDISGDINIDYGDNNEDLCVPYNLDYVIEDLGEGLFNITLFWEYFELDDDSCERIDDFSHFEISRDGNIIALIEDVDEEATDHSYTDNNLNDGDRPAYSVRAVFTNPFEKSESVDIELDYPLPIEIIDFSALAKENYVLIEWVTVTEINNDFYTIERSDDAKKWEIIDYKKGAGNSNQIIEYSYKDESPINGLSYYRLKQTDYDGRYEYFGPIAVFFDADLGKVNELNIKGLYVNYSYKVGLQIINKTTLDASLIVSDMKGNLLLNKYISPSNYIQNIDVNFDSNYSSNIIVIKLYNSFSLDYKKLIVN